MAKKFVFEEAMQRLEEIIGMLERGDAPLDESLALFEEGTGLIKQCRAALDQAVPRANKKYQANYTALVIRCDN